MTPAKKLSKIHQQILDAIKAHPLGISEGEIKALLGIKAEEQTQFGRRRRELHQWFDIRRVRQGNRTLYTYHGRKKAPRDSNAINQALRSHVLRLAHGRCAMCGSTVSEDLIKLVVDHKLPRSWGGTTELENLWAICEPCNQGKKDLFSSIESPEIKAAITHKSVHVRIGELLKHSGIGTPVPSYILEFVANQEDWHKRLRELRYLKWKIDVTKKKTPGGRVRSSYILRAFTEWPPDPGRWFQRYERERAQRNRSTEK